MAVCHSAKWLKSRLRDCPKRGSSNAPRVNGAGTRRAECTEKSLLSDSSAYAIDASGTFRTVSEGLFSEVAVKRAAKRRSSREGV